MNNIEALKIMKQGDKIYNGKNINMYFKIIGVGEIISDFGDKFTYEQWLNLTKEDNQENGWNIK